MERKYHTKIKDTIIEYIKENKEHCFCAADVCSYIKDIGLDANQATIYRNLNQLTKQKMITKFKMANSDNFYFRYESRGEHCQHHLHMQCRLCGRVYHLESDLMQEISKHLEETYEFYLECNHSTLSGLCRECKTRQEEAQV